MSLIRYSPWTVYVSAHVPCHISSSLTHGRAMYFLAYKQWLLPWPSDPQHILYLLFGYFRLYSVSFWATKKFRWGKFRQFSQSRWCSILANPRSIWLGYYFWAPCQNCHVLSNQNIMGSLTEFLSITCSIKPKCLGAFKLIQKMDFCRITSDPPSLPHFDL